MRQKDKQFCNRGKYMRQKDNYFSNTGNNNSKQVNMWDKRTIIFVMLATITNKQVNIREKRKHFSNAVTTTANK